MPCLFAGSISFPCHHLAFPSSGSSSNCSRAVGFGQNVQAESGPSLSSLSNVILLSVIHLQVVRVWFCNRRQKGKRSSSDYAQREDFEAAGSPFSGGPVSFPLAPGPHFGTPGYGSPHFTALYSSVPFPEGEVFPPVSVITLGSPMHLN